MQYLSQTICRGAGATLLTSACMFLGTASSAQGDDEDIFRQYEEEFESTSFTLGVATAVAPNFDGAKDYFIGALPMIQLQNWHGFNLSMEGLSYNLIEYESLDGDLFLSFSPRVGMADSRDRNGGNIFSGGQNEYLIGLNTVDFGLDIGGDIEVGYGPIAAGISFGQEVAGGHGGFTAGLSLGAMMPISRRLMFGAEVSSTWVSKDYMQAFYGIDATEAANSIYDEFEASAGFKDLSFSVFGEYRLTDNVRLTSSFGYSRLLNDASRSPLVTGPGGSKNQFFGLLGLTYNWHWK